MRASAIDEKSLRFAIRAINLYKHLAVKKKEFVVSKQFLRSGTAVGALVREAEHAQSKPDFLSKMNIALKEANETMYWLTLLHKTKFLDDSEFSSIHADAQELTKLLASIVKTTKSNINR